MSIVRVGSTKKYAEGWELIFGKGGKKGRSRATSAKSSKSSKKSPNRKRK